MSERNLGSGQYLDQNLDFEVDTTGDIQASNGIDELKKDLSVQMVLSLSQYLGSQPTEETETEVKRTVYRVAVADSRINAVNKEKISVEWKNRLQELKIDMTVVTDVDEEYRMVFNV